MLTAPRTSLHPWRAPVALVLAVTALRLAYLAWLCPYALVEDEAYYLLWARHLDWSYLTKGPGIALTIALGTLLAGDTELGVRLTAPLWGAVLALGVAALAGELAPATPGDPARPARARAWGAGVALLASPFQAAALLMTIDAPMLALWSVAAWTATRALARPAAAAWIALGAAVATASLFKLTVLVLVPVVAVLAARRPRVRWRWALTGLAIALLGLVPQVTWNAAHGWATAGHLGEHLSGPAPRGLLTRLGWVGEYLGLQALLGGPALLAGVLGASAARRTRETSATTGAWRVAAWCALAPYLLYLGVAAFTRVEGNWALGGLVPCLAMGGAWIADRTRGARHISRAIVIVGAATGLAMARLDWIARLPVIGPAVPLGRLTAGPDLASGVRARLGDLQRSTGKEPFVIAEHYGRAALLEFYLNSGPGEPIPVRCASSSLGGRLTQFDLWPGDRLDDPALVGRPALLLGGRPEGWSSLIGPVDEMEPIPGDHKARRVFVGWAYRAPAPPGVQESTDP